MICAFPVVTTTNTSVVPCWRKTREWFDIPIPVCHGRPGILAVKRVYMCLNVVNLLWATVRACYMPSCPVHVPFCFMAKKSQT